jgi:hypothetical protein
MPAIATIPITTAVTGATTAAIGYGANGIGGLYVITDFAYGSGGTSGKVYVQTSLDGTTWVDLVCMTFLTASKSRFHNVGRTSITTPYIATDGTLADDSVKDGVLSLILRTKLTTLGTYAGGTTLTVTAIPHAA